MRFFSHALVALQCNAPCSSLCSASCTQAPNAAGEKRRRKPINHTPPHTCTALPQPLRPCPRLLSVCRAARPVSRRCGGHGRRTKTPHAGLAGGGLRRCFFTGSPVTAALRSTYVRGGDASPMHGGVWFVVRGAAVIPYRHTRKSEDVPGARAAHPDSAARWTGRADAAHATHGRRHHPGVFGGVHCVAHPAGHRGHVSPRRGAAGASRDAGGGVRCGR